MYQKNQEYRKNGGRTSGASSAPVQLTKEEMRQKIRASLAAREAGETPAAAAAKRPAPAHAGHGAKEAGHGSAAAPARPVTRPATSSAGAGQTNRTNQEKARQIREAMASRRAQAATTTAPQPDPVYRDTRRPARAPKAPMRTRSDYPRERSEVSAKDLKKFFIIFGAVLAFALLAFYFGGMIYYNGKYLPHTYVNDVNIGGMTEAEAEDAIIAASQDIGITFVTNSGETITWTGSTIGGKTTLPEGALDQAYEGHGGWFAKLFTSSEYTVTLEHTYSEDALSSMIVQYSWGNEPPRDASIEQDENGDFYIQEEDNGNMVDTKILSAYALEQMKAGITTVDMASSGCYKTAKVTKEDLEDQLELYQQYGTVEITFDMTNREELFDPAGTVVLDHETYMNWITFDDDDTLYIDRDAATEWVQENIADPYDTFCSDGYSRTFDSTADGPVQVTLTPTSTYGWQCDVDATVDMIEQYLRDGESLSVEPEWVQAGFRPTQSDGTVFDEGTYIEIDISEQHLWFYVDGELYLDTPCVTGLAADPSRITNTGIFKIRAKYRDAVLGTYEVQGYECPVSYWMPIDHTGIGLHDLYRSAYGGEIYLTNGSHGCINLPLDMAGQIYEKTVVGMPVVIVD